MSESRRNRAPIFFVDEEERVLTHLSGDATLEMREPEATRRRLRPGDRVRVPAGTPTRILLDGANVVMHWDAPRDSRPAVAWYCDACGALVHQRSLEDATYESAVADFNADALLRTCACGEVHPIVELA